jgi:poly-gamma-glutamate synthesis protein (capsule biosynthesis protein)
VISYRIFTSAHDRPTLLTAYVKDSKTQTFKDVVEKQSVTVVVTGDVMLGRMVMQKYLEANDYTYPFHNVADVLKNADLTFINLENPIIDDCPYHTGGYIFCSPSESVESLKFAGVDVVSVANNHSKNYGEEGLKKTISLLEDSGINATGNHNLVIKEIGDIKFGFLGLNKAQQSQPVLETREFDLIHDSDKVVDVLIVGMHWGVEYQEKALPGVRALARELISHGADVIVGHHPHWVQDNEVIDGVPVYYSLGNFVFDQMWSEETKKGMVVRLTFDGEEVVKEEFLPTYIRNIGQPEFVNN